MLAALLLSVALVHGSRGASFCDTGGAWTTIWRDEFDGDALNTTLWSVVEGNDIGACRDALCTAGNVAVTGGSLVLTTTNDKVKGYNYTSGAVNSAGKAHWTYEPAFRLCVSAKLPGCVDYSTCSLPVTSPQVRPR
jgi:beta-glucanase (GH16 family)